MCLVAYGHSPTPRLCYVVRSAFDRGAPDDHGAMSVTSGVHLGPDEENLEVGAPLALSWASPHVVQIPRICLFLITEAQDEVGSRFFKSVEW